MISNTCLSSIIYRGFDTSSSINYKKYFRKKKLHSYKVLPPSIPKLIPQLAFKKKARFVGKSEVGSTEYRATVTESSASKQFNWFLVYKQCISTRCKQHTALAHKFIFESCNKFILFIFHFI